MTAAGRVAVIGDALIDELRDDTGVREFVGGAALNVAVGLARLGLPTTLIAMVGDDEPGDRIRAYLDDFGVELVANPSPHGSSRAVSTRNAGGEPVYVFNEAACNRRIHFGDEERRVISDAAITVVSCFPFDDAAQAAELADAVRAADGLLAVDPNPREGMMHDRAAFVEGFEALAALADLVKIGDDDAELLYAASLDTVRDRMREIGAVAVLTTRGAQGAGVVTDVVAIERPIAFVPGVIIDTMGAGDAVLSSAVASLLSEHPSDEAAWATLVDTAMEVAAATCRFEGALLRLPSALSGLDQGS
ncbi:PfkB family carbohydrate kinase [Microbacterium sp. SORGH_AS_0862]|uniref:PfkB family carbohydrate kinase n=1 Tax=Microbacterium sp. SORGH_AS_0862 TaxID=3041789 RepID=UPI0027927E2D|nr:PfkB family carbohydrate kinase [Microbacterium sp. SORGH_AS_0862]MDQ1205824.1 fructokinase [Microbacterium sp. SORGH_AS_0862]